MTKQRMNANELGKRIAVMEAELKAAADRANSPQVAMPMNVGMDMCAEKAIHRPSKTERRAKLIAAHVALEAIRHELEDYMHQSEVRKEIAAAIGRMELSD